MGERAHGNKGGYRVNETESLILQGLQLSIDRLGLEIAKQRQEAQSLGQYADMPAWIDLEQALILKRGISAEKKRAENGKTKSPETPIAGGASLTTYRQKLFLQPCCGMNYKMVGGRRCWKKDDVIAWLSITDEGLKDYADKYKVSLPDVYQRRSA
jgi:hypothetical protein